MPHKKTIRQDSDIFKLTFIWVDDLMLKSELLGTNIDISQNILIVNNTPYDESFTPFYNGKAFLGEIDTVSHIVNYYDREHKDGTEYNENNERGYGQTIHSINRASADRLIVATRLPFDYAYGSVIVLDNEYNELYNLCNGVQGFIASSKKYNSGVSLVAKTKNPAGHENTELVIINKHGHSFNIKNDLHLTEMLSCASGDDSTYMLQYSSLTSGKKKDIIFTVYEFDNNTGKKIDKISISFGNNTPPFKVSDNNIKTKAYFADNLSGEYGLMYSSGGNYAPHDYHDKGKIAYVSERTSCNAMMPCSQWIKSDDKIQASQASQAPSNDSLICMKGIDYVDKGILAVSYNEDLDIASCCETRIDCAIDIFDIRENQKSKLLKRLNLNSFTIDYNKSYMDNQSWTIKDLSTISGQRMVVTDKYIVIPVLVEPRNLKVSLHMESALAFYDKETYHYIGHQKIGKDYHDENTLTILHPNKDLFCDDESADFILYMDIVILDIDTDGDRVAISYSMSYNELYIPSSTIENPQDFEKYFPALLYKEVYTPYYYYNMKSVSNSILPVCERAENRYWRVGIEQD